MTPRHFKPRRGFTLTEILVVAVIIVLMIGMALPLFRAITGSRSENGARNVITAMLGRARADALGLQMPVGVAFVYNPATQVTYLAEVSQPTCLSYVQPTLGQSYPAGSCVKVYDKRGMTYYFTVPPNGTTALQPAAMQADSNGWQWVGGLPTDMIADTDLVPLSIGVAVQTVCNSQSTNGGIRLNDGYLSVGVILFDARGRLSSAPYGFARSSLLMTRTGLAAANPAGRYPAANVGLLNNSNAVYQFGVPAQFGLVIFQRDAFVGQNFPTYDTAYASPTVSQQSDYMVGTPSQKDEEAWLDENGTPLMLNRYTGTLLRPE